MEIASPVAGIVREILVPAGTTVKVGTRLAVVETAAAAAPKSRQPSRPKQRRPSPRPVRPSGRGNGPAGAQRLGEALPGGPPARGRIGLRPEQIQGTGRDGRITPEDVLAAMASGGGTATPAPRPGEAPPGSHRRRAGRRPG